MKEETLAKCSSVIEGEVMGSCVIGTTGKTYRGREVVSCVFPPGLFGTRKEGRTRRSELTLHNGIINQCSLTKGSGTVATPYWAVLDATITLKTGFTRKDVMDLAVKTVGEEKRRACEMAWDVLRNHHKHARKCEAGMGYMIDSTEGGKLMIRARDVGETVQYFAAQAGRKDEAEAVVAQAESPVAESVEVQAEVQAPVEAEKGA